MFKIETSHLYSFTPPEADPAKYDPSEDTFSCIADAFDASIMSQRILIDDVTLPADGCQAIAEAIIKGNGLAVSDGSFDPDISTTNGTSGFQLAATKDEKEDRLKGVNWVLSSPIDQSAYRSELTGIVGILATTAIIVQHYGIVTGGMTIALDGESALDEACGEWPLSIDQASYDLLQEIRNRVRELPIDVKWKWVEGHQKEKGIQNLDWWARRNDDVDAMAKSYLAQCTASNRPQIPVRLLYEKWAVYVHGVKQAKIDRKELYKTLFAPRTIDCYENHHDIPIPNGTAVDWEASRLAGN